MNDERGLLQASLDGQRAHVLGMLEGLSDRDLRRPVLPTGWTCLGLVQHLALDVEDFWFGRVVAGGPGLGSTEEGGDAWKVGEDVEPATVLDLYRNTIEAANGVITASSLDAPPAWWPDDLFGSFRMHSLRQIILHVITETACHAGHLDAARELIDRHTWLILT